MRRTKEQYINEIIDIIIKYGNILKNEITDMGFKTPIINDEKVDVITLTGVETETNTIRGFIGWSDINQEQAFELFHIADQHRRNNF
jgi:hypothetical protein